MSDTQLHTHNQYLNFLIAFGIVGFLLIVFFFARAIWLLLCRPVRSGTLSPQSTILFVAFLCIVLISFISEDTLETLAGITFTVMGFTLLSRGVLQCTPENGVPPCTSENGVPPLRQ